MFDIATLQKEHDYWRKCALEAEAERDALRSKLEIAVDGVKDVLSALLVPLDALPDRDAVAIRELGDILRKLEATNE